MGITASITITDQILSDEQLANLFLRPTGEKVEIEEAFSADPHGARVVVRRNGKTMIFDAECCFGEGFDKEAISLPGRWIAGMAVSTTGYFDLRVFDEGALVRRITVDDEVGQLITGEPIFDESKICWPATEEDRKYSDFEYTCDSDFLISNLAELASLADPGQEVWELEGELVDFDYDSFLVQGLSLSNDKPDLVEPKGRDGSSLENAVPEAPKKKGFFNRLFGG